MGNFRDTKFGTEETSNSLGFSVLEFISCGGKRSQTRCLAAPQRFLLAHHSWFQLFLSLELKSTLQFFELQEPQAESEGNDHEDRAGRDEKVVEIIMKTAQMHLVVATLLMTVTFTAGLTLPGGFESDTNSPNKGMAILLRRTAFRAFAVSNAIAFACSSGAVFAYFAMAANAISAVTKLTVIIQIYNMAIALQISAMAAVVVAFATGWSLIFAPSKTMAEPPYAKG
ncbi:hypothetical protein KY284_030405 [Solanum tuberosum]|nr:hypothetical protein KY284_030405 [Solanum tuberosum]